ncbi:hypothetical protein, partial [Enterococcus faecalis]|uniref:hypothetical protein n=1 Tax=Enterococcus faecalis TaxID=1351 RepID=UPI0030C7DE0C
MELLTTLIPAPIALVTPIAATIDLKPLVADVAELLILSNEFLTSLPYSLKALPDCFRNPPIFLVPDETADTT